MYIVWGGFLDKLAYLSWGVECASCWATATEVWIFAVAVAGVVASIGAVGVGSAIAVVGTSGVVSTTLAMMAGSSATIVSLVSASTACVLSFVFSMISTVGVISVELFVLVREQVC